MLHPPVLVRNIEGFPNHYIGVDGSFWSFFKESGTGRNLGWNRLKSVSNKKRGGRHNVVIYKEGKFYGRRIHRLVLEAFVGPCPEGMEARHLDDNPDNNHVDNLKWGTQKENEADRIRNGKNTLGESNGKSKLTEKKVRKIRQLYATGQYRLVDLGKRFGVSYSLIGMIVRHEIWRCV